MRWVTAILLLRVYGSKRLLARCVGATNKVIKVYGGDRCPIQKDALGLSHQETDGSVGQEDC